MKTEQAEVTREQLEEIVAEAVEPMLTTLREQRS